MSDGLTDLFAVLEVDRTADEQVIKKSYRKLVLKFHPDKHPDDRENAETKIREINSAYETLSNPAKRSAYEAQMDSIQRKARGVRLDTSGIQPKTQIPREFMLCPMGHPSKFVRTLGTNLFVHSREDVPDVSHKDFFENAKFSIWWVPEVNNMCRIRKNQMPGQSWQGLNFHWTLAQGMQESEIKLSPSEEQRQTNVVAVPSRDYAGAYRFESAHFPGYYLAFKPPNHIRMLGFIEDLRATVLDFMLMDFGVTSQFQTLEEVLIPVLHQMGGDKSYVRIDRVQQDHNIKMYFQSSRGRAVWQLDDFEIYFEAHWDRFDYDAKRQAVRLRGKEEKINQLLKQAKSSDDVASAIAGAGEELEKIGIDTMAEVLRRLSDVDASGGGSVTAIIDRVTAQKKMLSMLKCLCVMGTDERLSVKGLADLHVPLKTFGGSAGKPELMQMREEALEALAGCISSLLEENEDELDYAVLLVLLDIPLKWDKCGPAAGRKSGQALAHEAVENLIPLLCKAAAAKAGALGECIATAAVMKSHSIPPELSAEALDAMASGGFAMDGCAMTLKNLMGQVPFATLASVIAGLAEHGCEGADFSTCVAVLRANKSGLFALPPTTLVRLAVGGTRSTALADGCLVEVCEATVQSLQWSDAWSLDDISKLLLAIAKAKGNVASSQAGCNLFERAAQVITPKLPELSAVQLIKIVIAIGKVEPCKPLLEAAAIEATRRTSDLQPSQLLLLTQGLLPLGASSPSFGKIVDYWKASLAEDLTKLARNGDQVSNRRAEMETKTQLNADQLAKLAQLLSSVVPNHGVFESIATRLMGGMLKALTANGYEQLKAALPEKGGPSFKSKMKLLSEARRAKERSKSRSKGSSSSRNKDRGRKKGRSCSQERKKSRSRSQERKNRSHEKKKSRSRSQDKKKKAALAVMKERIAAKKKRKAALAAKIEKKDALEAKIGKKAALVAEIEKKAVLGVRKEKKSRSRSQDRKKGRSRSQDKKKGRSRSKDRKKSRSQDKKKGRSRSRDRRRR